MVKPFSPAEAQKAQVQNFPQEVIEVVNGFLGNRVQGNHPIRIDQDEVVEALVARGMVREDIFANKMLDFENVFRKSGWRVVYDKPAYNETYKPFWVFEPK